MYCDVALVHESFLEAYKDTYNHGDPEQFHQILMDIRSLGQHQRSMENLQQQMAGTGLGTEG